MIWAWRLLRSRALGRWAMIAALGLFPLGSMSLGSPQAADDPWQVLGVQRLDPPTEAPRLRLPDLDGHPVGLDDANGAVILLGFFTTT